VEIEGLGSRMACPLGGFPGGGIPRMGREGPVGGKTKNRVNAGARAKGGGWERGTSGLGIRVRGREKALCVCFCGLFLGFYVYGGCPKAFPLGMALSQSRSGANGDGRGVGLGPAAVLQRSWASTLVSLGSGGCSGGGVVPSHGRS